MSEENNQAKQAPHPANEGKEQHNNRRRNNHRHNHNRGRGRDRAQGEGGERVEKLNQEREQKRPEGAAAEAAAPEAAARKNDRPQKKGDRGNSGGNGNRDGRNRQNRGKPRHERERSLYDPYEAPDKQEIELSELRARIVLQAADGSAPTVLGTPVKPTEKTPSEAELAEAANAAAAILDSEASLTDEGAADESPRVEVIGVRFRSSCKTYYFDPRGIRAAKGDFAIVETTRGPEFGEVRLANCMVKESDTTAPLRPVLRIATPADIAHNEENRVKEQEALAICREKVATYKLEMNLIDVQYAFDSSKLLFYFSAEGRVDFRELVRDLASVFRTRIELRQIGIRDEAKMLGGLGACGRALCCSTFLPDFAQVSIKMAKDQSLSLNTSKISGLCGRLMCCLRYESDVYAEEIKKTPSNDTLVRTEDGVGVVIGSTPLAGTVRVLLKDNPDTAPKQYHRDSVTVLGKEQKGQNQPKQRSEKPSRAEKAEKAETPEPQDAADESQD